MVGGDGRDEPLALDRRELELAVVVGEIDRTADHPDVDLAADQRDELRHRRKLAQDELDLGVAAAELAQDDRQHRAEHRRADESQRERPERAPRDAERPLGRAIDAREDRPRIVEEGDPGGGERHPAAVALRAA